MPKILVVDDSPTVLTIITEALVGQGYHIITAADGEQALHKAMTEHPDLILLDVIMPGTNGFQVCRQLKAEVATQNIKIILVTSKRQASDRFWGLKQGADAYITKPFKEEDLLASIAQCL